MAKWETKNQPQSKGMYWITYLPNGVMKDLLGERATTVANRSMDNAFIDYLEGKENGTE